VSLRDDGVDGHDLLVVPLYHVGQFVQDLRVLGNTLDSGLQELDMLAPLLSKLQLLLGF
jgi:hypothetical protein